MRPVTLPDGRARFFWVFGAGTVFYSFYILHLLTTKTIVSRVATHAGVVELVDTQASGVCGGNPVEVQVLSSVYVLSVANG